MAFIIFIRPCRSTTNISKYIYHFIYILPLDLFNSTMTRLRQVLPCHIVVSASRNSEIPATADVEVEAGCQTIPSRPFSSFKNNKTKKPQIDHIKVSVLLAVDNELLGEVIFYIGHM